MEQKEFAAKSADLAIEQGLQEMGLKRENADIVILEEKGGIFKKARVRISKKMTEGEKAVFFIEKLLDKMELKAVAELKEDQEECLINLTTQDSSVVIGKRGETLDSIQYLASMYVNRDKEDFRRIVVDCENYREKRIENLKAMANKMAEKAIALGKKIMFDPMNPYERRIIHAELQKNTEVKTESRGEDPNRCVVIYPKNRKFDNRNKNFNRDRKPYNPNFKREGNFEKRGERREGDGRRDFNKPAQKKEISFGTFLGNVNDPNQK